MKKSILIILLTLNIPLYSHAGSMYYGCEKKLYQLKKQLRYAKEYGNKNRVLGLERAISNIESNCYDHYSGATGATKFINKYYPNETLQLEQEIQMLRDEINRLKSY